MLSRSAMSAVRRSGQRWVTSAAAAGPRVCIVGSGPSGFYAAKYLLKTHPGATVDIVDRLPTPFGLVRSGVAPDHPEVKNVTVDFESVAAEFASEGRFRYHGNVCVGEDVELVDLRKSFDAVLLAYGASSDRELGVPGEDLEGVGGARAFVNWYNGHPDHKNDPWAEALQNTEDVVIVGQGNVAIDCARVLTKTPDELRHTDITSYALDALAASRVRRVHVVGRRGHVQAAFTMKELRELTRLDDAALVAHTHELDAGATEASVEELNKSRAAKKIDALLRDTGKCLHADASGAVPQHGKSKEVHLRFLLSPTGFQAGEGARVGATVLSRSRLEGPAGTQSAVATGEEVTLPSQLVLRSIGYRSVTVPGLSFDAQRCVARNSAGRVVGEDGSPDVGLYVTGWLKRGPSGIIGTNIVCAKGSVKAILDDWEAGALVGASSDALAWPHAVDWEGWLRIDAAERAAGEAAGKSREKLSEVEAMIAASRG